MNWLSQSAETLIKRCTDEDGKDATVDVAVVGSGYGGAVAALRFSEHGQKVYVLERGKEYVAGEFPNDVSQVGKHVRSELATVHGVTTQGYEDALFDFRIGLRAGALIGNGLGGGSLINAGVGLQPDARVFKQPGWPAALRQADLADYFSTAEDVLELQTPGQPAPGSTQPVDATKTPKYQRLKELSQAALKTSNRSALDARNSVSVTFSAAPIAVQLEAGCATHPLGPRNACIGCGDCVTGCNHNAKLSLTATYLPRAIKAGAEIFTGLTVLHVSYAPEKDKYFPWTVHFIRTGERKLHNDITQDSGAKARTHPATDGTQWIYQLRARHVVLGAGTFGSTEILLRSRAKGLAVSTTALGVGVSGNGDDVAFGYDLKEEANAIGRGSKPQPPQPIAPTFVGPTISACIKFTDPDDLKRSTLVQDGAVPGLMQSVFHEMVTTLGTVNQMENFRFRTREGQDPLALDADALKRTITLLGIGHESAGGIVVMDTKSDHVGWGWPGAVQETTPELHKKRMKGCVETLGGLYLQNPAAGAVPDSLASIQSGPKAGGALFTVHPLGGCRMGDSMVTSVVNHWGAVWKEENEIHNGLYVMDGSVIPSALGANPMLTITALAERACKLIIADMDIRPGERPPRCLPPYPAPRKPLATAENAHSSTTLAETLRGKMKFDTREFPALAQPGAAAPQATCAAALFLEFAMPQWKNDNAAPQEDNSKHSATVVAGVRTNPSRYTASRLVMSTEYVAGQVTELTLWVTGGTVQLFCQRHDGGWTRTCRWVRTFLTYVLASWWSQYKKYQEVERRKKPSREKDSYGETASIWNRRRLSRKFEETLTKWLRRLRMAKAAIKLINHANEVRVFNYNIALENAATNKQYILQGTKVIEAAANCRALWKQIRKIGPKTWPAPERLSVWQQLTELDLTLTSSTATGNKPASAPLASGRLAMDLPDLLRRVMPKIAPQRDSLNALIELAGYPMLLLRGIVKTRILDFKLPDYKIDDEGNSALPDTDPALIKKPVSHFELDGDRVKYDDLPAPPNGVPVIAEPPIPLKVKHTWPKNPGETAEKITLGLIRYKQKSLSSNKVGDMHRAKSIVLLNGFDLSTKPFIAPELENIGGGNLATQLHHAGWDVWLFEYRASPLLDASARYSTMDDIAAFDIPEAVKHIINTVSTELEVPKNQTQIFAFTHCVGSATLAMSMLSGNLRHAAAGGLQPGASQLAGVLFSQFHPFMVGSATSQMRLQFAAFLSNVLKIETLQFTAGTEQASLVYAMMDRLFASANYTPQASTRTYEHVAHAECCPDEKDIRVLQSDTTTCKRMTGLLSRLFEHKQILDETHKKLEQYFGRSNMGVFLQGAKCVEYERLVNADGQNVYLTHQAISDYLDVPMMFIHGKRNVLFDKESLTRSVAQIGDALGSERAKQLIRQLMLPKNAHFDCMIGKNAPKDIFPPVVSFFNDAFSSVEFSGPPLPLFARCRARLPLTGPIVGWVRPGLNGAVLVRVWMEIDTMHGERPIAALSVLTYGAAPAGQMVKVQAWNITTEALQSMYPSAGKAEPEILYAVADIEVPEGCLDEVKIEMFGIYSYKTTLAVIPVEQPTPAELIFPTGWGIPMTTEEVNHEHLPDPPTAPVSLPGPPIVPPTAGRAPVMTGFCDQIFPRANLSAAAAALLREPLHAELKRRNATTRLAKPKTLSRQRRTLRAHTQRVISLQRPVLQDLQDGNLKFFAAACRHPGLTGFEYGRSNATLTQVKADADKVKPCFMWLLGDQTYVDARAGLLDTSSPIEKLLPRYRDAFGSAPGFRALAQRLPMYMVVDDHEINDNWSAEQALAGPTHRVLAANGMAAFNAFQFAHGPGAPADLTNPTQTVQGFNTSFERAGIPFIVLDTRTQRTRIPNRQILHNSQWRWLEAWLLDQQNAKGFCPKFITSGSVLAPGLSENAGDPSPRGADSWQMCPGDRQRLLSFVADNNIGNVVFLSSDYHCAAAATITFTHSKVKAWAIVAPPLHAPMRFANSQASDVLTSERVPLAVGAADVVASAWDGEGWLDCDIQRINRSAYQLVLSFNLRELEQEWPIAPATITAKTITWTL